MLVLNDEEDFAGSSKAFTSSDPHSGNTVQHECSSLPQSAVKRVGSATSEPSTFNEIPARRALQLRILSNSLEALDMPSLEAAISTWAFEADNDQFIEAQEKLQQYHQQVATLQSRDYASISQVLQQWKFGMDHPAITEGRKILAVLERTVHVQAITMAGNVLAQFEAPAWTKVTDYKIRLLECQNRDVSGVLDCLSVLAAKVVVDGGVLQDSQCLLDALPSSVIDSSSGSSEDVSSVLKVKLTMVATSSDSELRSFFAGRMKPYLIDRKFGPDEHRHMGRSHCQPWGERKESVEQAKADLEVVRKKLEVCEASVPHDNESRSDLFKAREEVRRVEGDLERLVCQFPADDPALKWLLGSEEERIRDPRKVEHAHACAFVYGLAAPELNEIEEEERVYESKSWEQVFKTDLPPLVVDTVVGEVEGTQESTHDQGTVEQGEDSSAVGTEATIRIPSPEQLPSLLYGLSNQMWSRFPIMRGSGAQYMMSNMLCWRAQAATKEDGYIPWKQGQGQEINFNAAQAEQIGRLFARHIELRLAKNGESRKYSSMPVSVLVPVSQFRCDPTNEAEDKDNIRSVWAHHEVLMNRIGVAKNTKHCRMRGDSVRHRYCGSKAREEVVDDDSDFDMDFDRYHGSGREELETDHCEKPRAAKDRDQLCKEERHKLRKKLDPLLPYVPGGVKLRRRMTENVLHAQLKESLPAFEVTLPTHANACPGAAECFSALVHLAAARRLRNMHFVIHNIDESHGDNWCVEADTPIAVIADVDGERQLDWCRADALRAGRIVAVAGDVERPACVVATIKSKIGAPLPMCFLRPEDETGPGVWITHEHPAWDARPDDAIGAAADAAACVPGAPPAERWQPSAQLAAPVLRTVPAVHNFVLDSGHVLCAGGVNIVTLAHGFSCKELVHPFWGTQECLDQLRAAKGFPDVILDSVESRRLQALGEAASGDDLSHRSFAAQAPSQDRNVEIPVPKLVQVF